jgi:hypothetical protein
MSSDIDWMLNNLSLFESLIGRAAGMGYKQTLIIKLFFFQLHANCVLSFKRRVHSVMVRTGMYLIKDLRWI